MTALLAVFGCKPGEPLGTATVSAGELTGELTGPIDPTNVDPTDTGHDLMRSSSNFRTGSTSCL